MNKRNTQRNTREGTQGAQGAQSRNTTRNKKEEEKVEYFDKTMLWHNMNTALKAERRKYQESPPKADMIPLHTVIQYWGYVTAAYFLIEQGMKALLVKRGEKVEFTHNLNEIYNALEPEERQIINEYYTDFLKTTGEEVKDIQIRTAQKYLDHLDGRTQGGKRKGSMDWRYLLIESHANREMPKISINLMHEIALACVLLIKEHRPEEWTHSHRLHSSRKEFYKTWEQQMIHTGILNRPIGRVIEILWGPDYKGRYDLMHSINDGKTLCAGLTTFEKEPEPAKNGEYTVIDRRKLISRVLPKSELIELMTKKKIH